MKPALLPELFSVDLFAQLLDCSAGAVEEATRDGRLPGVKYGRSWVYPREAALQVLNAQALENLRRTAEDGALEKRAPAATPLRVAMPAAAGRRGRRGMSPAPLPDPPVAA